MNALCLLCPSWTPKTIIAANEEEGEEEWDGGNGGGDYSANDTGVGVGANNVIASAAAAAVGVGGVDGVGGSVISRSRHWPFRRPPARVTSSLPTLSVLRFLRKEREEGGAAGERARLPGQSFTDAARSQ